MSHTSRCRPRGSQASPEGSGTSRHSTRLSTFKAGSGSYPSSFRSAASIHPRYALSPVQEAILQESIHRLELVELQSQIIEDSNADLEYQCLNTQAREAQRLQQEAQEAREAIAKRLDRQGRLKKKEKEFQVAKLVTSLLQEPEGKGTRSGTASPRSCQSSPALVAPLPVNYKSAVHYSSAPHLYASSPNHDAIGDLPSNFPYSQPSRTRIPDHDTSMPTSSYVGPSLPPPLFEHPPAPQNMQPPPAQPVMQHPFPQPAGVSPAMHPPSQVTLPAAATTAFHPARTMPAHSELPIMSHQASAVPTAIQGPQYFAAGPHFTTSSAHPYQHMNSAANPMVPIQPSLPPEHLGSGTMSTSLYGIPQPILPVFERDRERDSALLKMALDNLMGSHGHLTEQYKYQVLLGHLKLPSALHLAKAYMYDTRPYTAALQASQDKYGQPRQLVQSELGAILNSPAIKFGDSEAFESFALCSISTRHAWDT
ncbi:arginine-glutamic acid dipeptide repeats protein-like [Thalassophryne amazonica]|uniref:arginine-glutamic acid dipeptide repeats protein-like n=1 Tax=Thalassophryne amazonica TaxID=390379 RepID=UPI00147133E3|nr:arginine-glutamic acid dipeptide repeats protein-like [Thalassophryne amazonica]